MVLGGKKFLCLEVVDFSVHVQLTALLDCQSAEFLHKFLIVAVHSSDGCIGDQGCSLVKQQVDIEVNP